MIKEEIQRERDALKERLEFLRDFYQKQKDMLREQYEEDKYLEEQEEKRRRIAEIEAELARLQYDDSAWAQRRRLELMQELADAQADLDDFEREHAIQSAQDYLDELYERQEEEINNEIDLLDERENDAIALYQQALDDIRNGSIELYNEMIEWNSLYGDGITETITSAWEEAYKALQAYMNLFGEAYEGINLGNYTGYNPDGSWDDHPINGGSNGSGSGNSGNNNGNSGNAPTLERGATIQVKSSATNYSPKSGGKNLPSFVRGGNFTVYQLDGNEVLIGRDGVYTGWIYKHDIVGYARGTRHAAPGFSRVDELGAETLFTSSDGSHYRLFSGGEKVLNARASNFLYDFATHGSKIFDKLIKRMFGSGPIDHVRPITGHTEVTMGDIIIHGNANEATVSEIRRAQRDSLNSLLHEFDRLNR